MIDRALRLAGRRIMREATFAELDAARIYRSRSKLLADQFFDGVDLVAASRSQIGQDLFVLSELNLKKGGYFVEFGATDGLDLSNSYLLEKQFGWTGILAEPSPQWRESLLASGRAAQIDFDCVWTETGQTIEFMETAEATHSTIHDFVDRGDHARQVSKISHVQTVSLTDLLQRYNAPAVIDYLSIDTEGSEFAILNAFDFSRYKFRCITCEHNYEPVREEIWKLLTSHGYTRVREEYSQWDDWYVLGSI